VLVFRTVAVGKLSQGGDQPEIVEGGSAQIIDQAPDVGDGGLKLRTQLDRSLVCGCGVIRDQTPQYAGLYA
jgi:hypothetical protein